MSTTSGLATLFKTSLKEIAPDSKIVVIDAKEPLPKAFHTLTKANIYSAPVYDADKQEYYGFLDMVDVVAYIVKIYDETEEGKSGKRSHSNFYTLLEQVCKFDQVAAGSVADLSKRNPMCPLKPSDTVADALKVFSTTGTHRIPLITNANISSILTQSMLVSWLSTHLDLLGDVANKTVSELSLFKEVISVRADDLAIEAFKLMNEKKINAVAVLDNDGSLMTTLSAKDIKVLDSEALFTKLYKTTLEFVSASRSHELQTTAPAMTCHLNTDLKEIIMKLGHSHRHRIWITDSHKKLQGVISLVDIFKVLVANAELRTSERILK